jgi:hypothetical protein
MSEPWLYWLGGFFSGLLAAWAAYQMACPRPGVTSQDVKISTSLKSLDQYSADREAEKWKSIPGNPTDCACPECGERLFRYLRSSDSWQKNPRDHLFCRQCRKDFYSRPPEAR